MFPTMEQLILEAKEKLENLLTHHEKWSTLAHIYAFNKAGDITNKKTLPSDYFDIPLHVGNINYLQNIGFSDIG